MTIGPQRGPSSLSKIKAETKRVQRELGDTMVDELHTLREKETETARTFKRPVSDPKEIDVIGISDWFIAAAAYVAFACGVYVLGWIVIDSVFGP